MGTWWSEDLGSVPGKCLTQREDWIRFTEFKSDTVTSTLYILLYLGPKKEKEKKIFSVESKSDCSAIMNVSTYQVSGSLLCPFLWEPPAIGLNVFKFSFHRSNTVQKGLFLISWVQTSSMSDFRVRLLVPLLFQRPLLPEIYYFKTTAFAISLKQRPVIPT